MRIVFSNEDEATIEQLATEFDPAQDEAISRILGGVGDDIAAEIREFLDRAIRFQVRHAMILAHSLEERLGQIQRDPSEEPFPVGPARHHEATTTTVELLRTEAGDFSTWPEYRRLTEIDSKLWPDGEWGIVLAFGHYMIDATNKRLLARLSPVVAEDLERYEAQQKFLSPA